MNKMYRKRKSMYETGKEGGRLTSLSSERVPTAHKSQIAGRKKELARRQE